MLNGVVNLLVDHFLVNLGIVVTAERFAVGGGQTHHAVAQDGNFLVGLGILAIGHLAHRRLLYGHFLVIARGAAHDDWSSGSGSAQPQSLEEGATRQGLAAFIVVMLVIVHFLEG